MSPIRVVGAQVSRRAVLIGGLSFAISSQKLLSEALKIKSQTSPLSIVNSSLNLRLLTPGMPDFNQLLSTNFPALENQVNFREVSPLLVLITCDDTRSLKACSVKWSIVNSSGATFEHIYGFMNRARVTQRIFRTGQHPLLTKGHVSLVSPFFWLTSNRHRNPRSKTDLQISDFIGARSYAKALLARASNASLINAALDAAILDVGSNIKPITGPDEGRLSDRFSVVRNAEHDEAVSVITGVGSSKDIEDYRNLLVAHLKGAQTSVPEGPPSRDHAIYLRARWRYAKALYRCSMSDTMTLENFGNILAKISKTRPTLTQVI